MKRLDDETPDAAGDVLGTVRFKSTIFCRSELSAPWGFSVAAREIATFHFVEHGDCWLEVADVPETIRLRAGDLVLLPHGHPHVVRDAPGSPVTALDDLVGTYAKDDPTALRCGGGGAETALVCGGFVFENRDALPFLPALPPVLRLGEGAASWLRVAQEIVAGEVRARRMGANTILSRACDLLFIEAVRTYFSDASGGPRGWLAALRDRHVGSAISLIHREPERRWTVGSLASAVGMSRSAFALRFSVLLGESPIRYLARRRIDRAGRLLETGAQSIAQVAQDVGYESEVAFSRAFKRQVGLTPVEFRRARLERTS